MFRKEGIAFLRRRPCPRDTSTGSTSTNLKSVSAHQYGRKKWVLRIREEKVGFTNPEGKSGVRAITNLETSLSLLFYFLTDTEHLVNGIGRNLTTGIPDSLIFS